MLVPFILVLMTPTDEGIVGLPIGSVVIFSHHDGKESSFLGTSLAVQWLRLHASTAAGMGSIPWLGN